MQTDQVVQDLERTGLLQFATSVGYLDSLQPGMRAR